MKLKRFLALAVSLAMVLSIVPAFSLTASAAVGDAITFDGITYTVTGENLVPDGGFDDGNGNFSWGTWFSPNGSNGNFADNCGDWFYKVNRDTDAAVLYTQSLTADDYALGTRWNDGSTGLCSLANNIAVEAGKTYHIGFDYKHKSGADTGYIVTTFVTTATASTDGTKILTPAYATTSWQTASTVYTAPSDGYVFFHFRWLGADGNPGNGPYWYFDNFVVEEVALPEASTEGTIKAALDDLALPLATKTDITLPATATDSIGTTVDVAWTSSNADVIANDGTVTSPADITTVTMTPSAVLDGATVTGDAKNVVVFPASVAGTEYNSGSGVYTIGSDNIIATAGTAASFEGDGAVDLTGWNSHLGSGTHATGFFQINAATEVVPDGNWAYASQWSDNITGTNYCTIDTMWAVEAGKYYLSFYAKKENNTNGQVYVYYSTDNANHTTAASLTSEAWVEQVVPTSEWVKYEYIIEATEAGYIGFTGYNLSDGANGSRGTFFDDFELYTAEQQAETLASVPEVGAEITVIAGNTPILPGTVTGTGTLGSGMEVAVTWDATGLDFTTAGTVTVPGTVDGTEFTTSAVVTVLAETFSIADSASKNGQPGNVVYFPVEIADEFTVEFDLNIVRRTDVSVQMGYNGTMFSAAALGISPNGGVLKVTGGSKNGSAGIGHTLVNPVSNGDTYRVLLTMDASDDTYSVTVTSSDGTTATVSEQGFRQAHDAINTMTLVTNGSGSMGDTAADGDITISNVKVNSTVAKTEYTIVTTIDDAEPVTTTASYWTEADALAAIQDMEGFEKNVNVDGTTINVTYTSVYATSVTYYYMDGENKVVVKSESANLKAGETLVVEADSVYYAAPTGVTESDDRSKTVVYLGAGAYYELEAVTANAGEAIETEVTASTTKIGVLRDTAVSRGGTSFYGVDNNNVIRVASAGDGYGYKTDANGEPVYKTTDGAPSTLGTARDGIVEFPVVDLKEGQKATMTLYVGNSGHDANYTLHGNGYANGTYELRFMATVLDSNAWVEAKEWVNDGSFNIEATLAGTNVIYSDFATNTDEVVTFDVTEAMAVAKAAGRETISFRLLAQYGAYTTIDREKTVENATENSAYALADQAGKAAYIAVEDAGLVKVTETGSATLTKNGSDVNGVAYVAATDDVRLVASDAVVVSTDAGYYYANTTMAITEATAFENTAPAGLGLAMVSGAQVRIGTTELADGAKLDALADSGIRFLATADYTDTVLSDDAVEFGVKVTAEGSDKVTYVPAVNFQNADETVFSAAITGLAESNYNRNYTAVAYAKVPMADGSVAEFTTDSVTRSVYQVSAGIMKNGTADADNAAYTVDGVVKNILNAYVNQTGIRLTYTADGITVEEGKYTGDVFFTVESTVNEDGSVAVTITPDTTWGTPAEIATWWTDYVRVNNNNSVAKTYISNEAFADGVLTFTFTVPAAE